MMKALPGTPYTNQAKLSPEQIATLNQKYGFNKPLWVQYFMYLGNLLHGDLGTSFQFNNQPVTQLIGNHVGPSVQLGLQAMILGTILGIILGSIAAIKKNTAGLMPLPRLFQFWVYQFLVLCWQFFFSGSLVSKFSYFQLPSGMDLVRQSSQRLP